MSQKTRIVDDSNTAVDIRRGRLNGRPYGMVTYNQDLYEWPQRSLLLTNEVAGRDMNVNGATGGTTEQVYDGGDTAAWTATAITGTWLLTDTTEPHTGTASIRAWDMTNGALAALTKGSDIDMSNFASISGWVYISRLNELTQQIQFAAYDNSVIVGGPVNVIDYVDGGLNNIWQRFVIPREDFGIGDVNIDEIDIEVIRPSGSAPRFYLDDIEINQTGGVRFSAGPSADQIIEYNRVEFVLCGPLAGTLADGTMPALSFEKLLNIPTLANGITLQRILDGSPRISVAFRSLGDFSSLTYDVVDSYSDGTNTTVKLRSDLPVYSRLNGINGDTFNVTINDDLSSLLIFRCVLVGRQLDEYEFEDSQ